MPKINVDPQKTRQVILNLIDNAIKYTKKGGITVKVQHNSSTNSENGTILITVKDTGIGLTTKDINNLFNYLKEAILLLKLMLLVLVLVFMRPKRLLKPIEARSGQNLPAETRVLPFMLNYQ
ncbi:MAG TPA: ATP-binding protein [Candidatus Pacearchaeota archaeon]|nr:ATP-binding protein [Candidatus Pacearchaeota archaeon]